MCKFCKGNKKIETTIDDRDLAVHLDEESKKILNIRLPYTLSGGITRPIIINFCPFCGNDLGDGIDDISQNKHFKRGIQ